MCSQFGEATLGTQNCLHTRVGTIRKFHVTINVAKIIGIHNIIAIILKIFSIIKLQAALNRPSHPSARQGGLQSGKMHTEAMSVAYNMTGL